MTASEPVLRLPVPEQGPVHAHPTAGGRTRPERAALGANRGWFALDAALAAGPNHPGALGSGLAGDRRERYFRIVGRAAR